MNLVNVVQYLRDFGRFEMNKRHEKITFYLQQKKFVTKSKSVSSSNHFQLTCGLGLLEKIPVAIRREKWYLHDGVPPHYV
jgi:hypothetical protein